MVRTTSWLCVCLFSAAHCAITYQDINSRLAMMEYGNESDVPAVPSFLDNSFTMTYVADIRGQTRETDEVGREIKGKWSHVVFVKLAYIAFLTGKVLEPPTKTPAINLNFTIWFADECMNYQDPSVCSAPYAMKKFMEILYGNALSGTSYPPSQAAVGPFMNSLEAVQVATLKDVPMVGYANANALLSNKINFPTYLRTKPSGLSEATAMAVYLRYLNQYTRIDTISCDTISMRSLIPEQTEVFRQHGIVDNYVVFMEQGPYTAITPEFEVSIGIPGAEGKLERWQTIIAGLRVNNAHVHNTQLPLSCPGYDIIHYLGMKGFVGSGHLWIGGDIDLVAYFDLYLQPIRYVVPYQINAISPLMWQSSCDAYIAIKMPMGKYVNSFNEWVKTLEDKRSDLFEPWLLQHIPVGAFANITTEKASWWHTSFDKWRLFDAVWSVLLAVNNLVNKTGTATFSSGALQEELFATRFEGLSGLVRFRNNRSETVGRGDRIADYEFHQFRQPGTFPSRTCGNNVTTGVFSPALVALQCVFPPAGYEVHIASFGETLTSIQDANYLDESFPIFYGNVTVPPPNLNKACLKGESYDVVNGVCNKCPAGRFTDETDQSSCNACEPGTYAKDAGTSSCLPCLQGTFAATKQSTICSNCSAGTYANEVQQKECSNCTVETIGQYSGIGFANCFPCQAGEYQDEAGQGQCKQCGDVLPGTTSEKGAKLSVECYCESGSYYREGGFGCTACVEGLECPRGRSIPTQKAGFYAEIVDEGTMEYAVFECVTEEWCPAGALASCTTPRVGRSCAVVDAVKCPFWVGLILPLCLLVMVYLAYRASANARYGKVSSVMMLAGNLGIALSAMQAVNVYLLLFDEIPEELHWLLQFVEFFMFNWRGLIPECNVGQAYSARFSMTIFPPLLIVGASVFNWTITNMLRKTPVAKLIPPMTYGNTWNAAGIFIQVMYIMQCKDAFSYFASKSNPCGKDTLQDFTDVIFWSDEHTAFGPLLITIYLWLFYVIGTYVVFTFTVITAPTNMKNKLFWVKWRFIFARWRPECRHWGCFMLARNFCIALTPIVVRTDQVYQALVFILIVGGHAIFEAHYVPWMTYMNNFFEIGVSMSLICMGIVGLAFTETASDSQRVAASFVMIFFMLGIWAGVILSIVYAIVWASPAALQKRQERGAQIGNDLLEQSTSVFQAVHNDNDKDTRDRWHSYAKSLSAYDKHIFKATLFLLKGFDDQDDFRKRMQSRYSNSRHSTTNASNESHVEPQKKSNGNGNHEEVGEDVHAETI